MMNKERAEKLDRMIEDIHELISEFTETVKKSDMKWAQKYLNSENCEDDGDLECTAESLVSFGENLKDIGKNFDYNFE